MVQLSAYTIYLHTQATLPRGKCHSFAAFICLRWWIDLFTYTWIQLLVFVFSRFTCFGTGGSVFEDWAQQDFLVVSGDYGVIHVSFAAL